uniref:tigger transposable element-derived protein 1-like n=1 Tax=Myxine glutinosa TaxID=7769 RepID=UPI00358FC47C
MLAILHIQTALDLDHCSRPVALTCVLDSCSAQCSIRAPKRKTSAGDASTTKRQEKVMSPSQKVELLDRLSRGESAASMGRHYGVNESTVLDIRKNGKAICESVSASAVSSMKVVTHVWDVHIERMEKALSIWIEDNVQKCIPVSGSLIREKAKQIYDLLSGTGVCGASTSDVPSDDCTSSVISFTASREWLNRFKEWWRLKNVKLSGERACADHEAAKAFPAQLARLIEEKGYLPEQVFNADETGLFWKKMPTRTFMSKREETASRFKAAKDWVSLLLCTNTKGYLMLKPMMLYRSLNPRALKGKKKQTLPMFWRANRKAWVMAAIFLDWFHNGFVPQVERFKPCIQAMVGKNLAFKVLLLLDNVPSHPVNLDVAHPNVEVIFLPPNTTSLIQPLDHGVISTFKTYYTHRTFHRILDAIESDPGLTVGQCWKDFIIAHCIGAINESLDEVRVSTINACWHNLWPQAVRNFTGFADNTEERHVIVGLAWQLGGEVFYDMQPEELEDLIASHGDKLTEEELEVPEPIESTSEHTGINILALDHHHLYPGQVKPFVCESLIQSLVLG